VIDWLLSNLAPYSCFAHIRKRFKDNGACDFEHEQFLHKNLLKVEKIEGNEVETNEKIQNII